MQKSAEDFLPLLRTHKEFSYLCDGECFTLKANGFSFADCDLSGLDIDNFKAKDLNCVTKAIIFESLKKERLEIEVKEANGVKLFFSQPEEQEESPDAETSTNILSFEPAYDCVESIATIEIIATPSPVPLRLLCINMSKESHKNSKFFKAVKNSQPVTPYSTVESRRVTIVGDNKTKLSFHAVDKKLDFANDRLQLPRVFAVKVFGNDLKRSLALSIGDDITFQNEKEKDNLKFLITVPDTFDKDKISITLSDVVKTNYYNIGPINLITITEPVEPVRGATVTNNKQAHVTLGKHSREDENAPIEFQSAEKKRSGRPVEKKSSSTHPNVLSDIPATEAEIPNSALTNIMVVSAKYNLSQLRMVLFNASKERSDLEMLVNYKGNEINTTIFLIGLYRSSKAGKRLVERSFVSAHEDYKFSKLFLSVNDWPSGLWSDILNELNIYESTGPEAVLHFILRIAEELVQFHIKKFEYSKALNIVANFPEGRIEHILNLLRAKRTQH